MWISFHMLLSSLQEEIEFEETEYTTTKTETIGGPGGTTTTRTVTSSSSGGTVGNLRLRHFLRY